MTHNAVPIVLALSLAGCVALPATGPDPECDQQSDCNTGAGEVCSEGLCWGDPPSGQFAVVISPPGYREDLVATELSSIAIASDGTMDPMITAWPVYLHGRVEADCGQCPDGATIPATVTVRRPSRIPGAEAFLASTATNASTSDSFGLWVPQQTEEDAPFVVTITPSETEPLFPDGPTPAELVPPLRLTVTATELDYGLAATLSADQIRTVSGEIVGAGGGGVGGMKVYAKGRVDPMLPLERVSTIATSNQNGEFTLLLGADALDVIDIVAVPPDTAIAPTLYARDRFAGSQDPVVLTMPELHGAARVKVAVVSADTSGSTGPVPNARVEIYTDPTGGSFDAIFAVSGQTDDRGELSVDVLAGAEGAPATYKVRVTPEPNAIHAAKLETVEVDADGGDLPLITLDQRSAVSGVIVDHIGDPVDGITVTAVPSLFFLWTLDASIQKVVLDRGRPETFTNPDGTFTLWVDPSVSGYGTTYDLEIQPADFSSVPRTTFEDIDGAASIDLGFKFLPDAAYVRGVVTDPDGNALADALVKVYEVVPDPGVCVLQHAPNDCQPPAIVRATGRTDANGVVRLTLPR